MSPSHEGKPERILIVETNKVLRESLAERLRSSGFEVVTSVTSESDFDLLRDRMRPVGWLYSRADLPGLMDGWILADEYHDSHPEGAVPGSGIGRYHSGRPGQLLIERQHHVPSRKRALPRRGQY